MPTTQPSTTESQSRHEVPAGAAFVAHLYRWWWLIAGQAVATVVTMVFVLAVTGNTTYDHTAHFVLHPDPASDPGDAANAESVLRQDGPVVQTVLKVLGSDEILRRAGAAAEITDTSNYSLSATVSPGSSYFDAAVSGENRETTAALGKGLETVAPRYVEDKYSNLKFDVLGSEGAQHDPFPPSPSLLLLVLLLGAVAAVGELFITFGLARLRPMVRLALDEAPDREATVEGPPVPVEPVAAEPVAVRFAVEPMVGRRSSARSAAHENNAGSGNRRQKSKRPKRTPATNDATAKQGRESTWPRAAETAATERAASEQAATAVGERARVTESNPDHAANPRSSAGS